MKRYTLQGFRNFFSSQFFDIDSSRESSFRLDFSKGSLKEKEFSNRSRGKGISSLILLLILFLFSNFLSAQIIKIDGLSDSTPGEWNQLGITHIQDLFGNGVKEDQFATGTKDFFFAVNMDWAISQTKGKTDIANGAGAILPKGGVKLLDGTPAPGGPFLVYAGDRTVNNGDAQIGFWFFQDGTAPVSVSGKNLFDPPKHIGNGTSGSVGDILVLADFTGGGRNGTVTVLEWVGTGGTWPNSNGAFNSVSFQAAVAENNDGTTPVPSTWLFPTSTYDRNEFFEGYVDLASFGAGSVCFSRFMLEARSSQSITAELDDFIGGPLGGVPEIPTPGPVARCGTGSVDLTASGCIGGTLKWYATTTSTAVLGTGTTYSTPSISQTTSYFVSCTNATGCESKRAEVKATINPNPTVTVNSPVICVSDKTATITATPSPAGTYTYKWTVPSTAGDPGNVASFSASVAGEYSVVITDGTSTKCTGTGKGTLTINPLPKIVCPNSANAKVICAVSGAKAQELADADFATWFAQFKTNNPGFEPVVKYDYTPASAQPATGTAPVIPIIGTPALANPTSVTVTWTIKDINGCENSCSATYSQEYACDIACKTVVTNLNCNKDSSGTITVTAGGGTQPYIIYLYKSTDIVNPIADSGTLSTEPGVYKFSNLAAGDYVTESTDVVNLKGSGKTCEATVTEPKAVVLEISNTNVSCYGLKDGTLSIGNYDGTGTPTFSLSSDGTNFTVTNKTDIEAAKYGPGTYYIKVCYPDGNTGTGTCCLTKSTTIKEPTLVSIKISGTNVTCSGSGDGKLSIVNYSGDGIPTFYLKKDAGSFVETTIEVIDAGSYGPGTYTIKVAFSDGNNPPGSGVCSIAEDKVIIEPSQVSLTISSTNVICNGKADGKLSIITYTGTGTPTFYLKIGAGNEVLTTKDAIVAGSYGPETYYIRVSYPDGNNPPGSGTCSETKSTTISQPDAVVAKDESTKANCIEGKDGSVTLTFSGGTPPYMVNFNGGGFATQTSPITYSGLAVGTYNWIVKDANECSVPGSEDVGFIPCIKALCTYTQGYYGNSGGMSCVDGVKYTTTDLITKALGYYNGKMIVGSGLNTVTISTPSCVIKVLPGGGGSYKISGDNTICGLPSSYLKNGRINNTLLAQTITLGLNIGINSALGNFALQVGTLATAAPDGGCGSQIPLPRTCTLDVYTPTINEYKYYTLPAVVGLLPTPTVQGLYDMANKALGGEILPAGFTLSNLASAVDLINNAFDGCRISMGYDQKPLVCLADRAAFIVSPNPILDFATITYQFSYVSDVTIQVFSGTGSLLYTQLDTNSSSCLGKQVKITYPFTTSGSYIIKIITNIGSSSKIVIK